MLLHILNKTGFDIPAEDATSDDSEEIANWGKEALIPVVVTS